MGLYRIDLDSITIYHLDVVPGGVAGRRPRESRYLRNASDCFRCLVNFSAFVPFGDEASQLPKLKESQRVLLYCLIKYYFVRFKSLITSLKY